MSNPRIPRKPGAELTKEDNPVLYQQVKIEETAVPWEIGIEITETDFVAFFTALSLAYLKIDRFDADGVTNLYDPS
jgi:hypothetical protein